MRKNSKGKDPSLHDNDFKIFDDLKEIIRNPGIFYCDNSHPEITFDDKFDLWQGKIPEKLKEPIEKKIDKVNQIEDAAKFGNRKREQQRIFSQRGVDEARRKADSYRSTWLKNAEKLRTQHPDWTTNRLTKAVHEQLQVQKTHQTLYKFLLKNLKK